jgi:hypothetical protein
MVELEGRGEGGEQVSGKISELEGLFSYLPGKEG